MPLYILCHRIEPITLPGGVAGVGNSVVINSYDGYRNMDSYFYCIVDVKDKHLVSFEAEKEWLRISAILAYILGIGMREGVDFESRKVSLLNKAEEKDFPDLDYVRQTVKVCNSNYYTMFDEENEFKYSQEFYDKLLDCDIFHYQASQYLTRSYVHYGSHDEAIINFTKVVESIVLALNGGKGNCKLSAKNLNLLQTNLDLSDAEIDLLKKLNNARDQLAAHGVLNPELEYTFGVYNPEKHLSRYFGVTCGPNFGLGDLVAMCEPAVRKCYSKFLQIKYTEPPIELLSKFLI